MPKLIDRALATVRRVPPPLTPDEIQRRLAATRQTLAGLVTDHQRAALDAEAGVEGAPQRLAGIKARQAEARDRIATLESALIEAEALADAERRKLQGRLRRANIAKITAALDQRDKAAERLADALEIAGAAWRELVELSERAAIPVPGLPEPNADVLADPHKLRLAVEREMFRVGAWPKGAGSSPGRDPRNMPGGNPHDFDFEEAPHALPRLADEIKRASAYYRRELTGEPLEPVR